MRSSMAARFQRFIPCLTHSLFRNHEVRKMGFASNVSSPIKNYRKVFDSFCEFMNFHINASADTALISLGTKTASKDSVENVVKETLSKLRVLSKVEKIFIFQNEEHLPWCALLKVEDSDTISMIREVFNSKNQRVFRMEHNLNEKKRVTKYDIHKHLSQCLDMTDQMLTLHKLIHLDECGIRQRFLLARILEESRLLGEEEFRVFPFGSTVSGIGTNMSDLDLVIYNASNVNNVSRHILAEGIRQVGKSLLTVGSGIVVENVIDRARIPIVKFQHVLTGLDCDVCINEMNGLPMAEMIYVMCEFNGVVVRPLITTILTWAKSMGLSKDKFGYAMKTLILTHMVIFYLQHSGVLPAYLTLIDCSKRNTNIGMYKRHHQLSDLLYGFFHFYHKFDYKRYSIHVGSGQLTPKFRHALSYELNVQNPMKTVPYNIAFNVSDEHFSKFKYALEVGLHNLDEYGDLLQLFHTPINTLFENTHIV